MKRRDVIRQIMIGGTTIMVVPLALNSCEKEETENDNNGTGSNSVNVDLNAPSNSALLNPGGYVIVNNIIVVNSGGGKYIALSSVCTHDGCTVSYNPSTGNFPCGCHNSLFAVNGSVLNGPAVKPLTAYPVTQSGNILTIQR